MSYTINNTFNPFAFIGQIVAYRGTSDPPGWVICNGQTRVNTGGIYNNLANTGLGSISGGNYTPLDLRSHFICGFDNTNPIGSKYAFPDNTNNHLFTLENKHMPNHNHGTITTASGGGSHTHTHADVYFADGFSLFTNTDNNDGSGLTDTTLTSSNSTYATNHGVLIGDVGEFPNPTQILLQHRSIEVNWIIKL